MKRPFFHCFKPSKSDLCDQVFVFAVFVEVVILIEVIFYVVARAAKEIGVSRSHFYKLMEAFEIPLGFGLAPLKKKQCDERKKKKADKNRNKQK